MLPFGHGPQETLPGLAESSGSLIAGDRVGDVIQGFEHDARCQMGLGDPSPIAKVAGGSPQVVEV